MPVLSLDYSSGSATAFLLNDDLRYKLAKVPVASPKINFFNKPNDEDVFLNVLASVEKELKVTLNQNTKIYVSSLFDLNFKYPNLVFLNKNDCFKSLFPMDFLYFSHLHVGDNRGVYSENVDYAKLLKDIFFDEKEETLENYFGNLQLYPYTNPSSDRDQYEEMAYLRQIAKSNCSVVSHTSGNFLETKGIICSTTRDLSSESAMCRFMLLCVDSICSDGFFYFRLDYGNFLGASSPISLVDSQAFQKIETPDFVPLGSLVSFNDDLDLSFESESGAKEELKLPRNQVFTLPVLSTDRVNLTFHSRKYGTLNKVLTGGAFGLVIDTRDKEDSNALNLEQKKNLVKSWEEILLVGYKNL